MSLLQKQSANPASLRELGHNREAVYNTNDKHEEDDIEDQIRASKKHSKGEPLKKSDTGSLKRSGSLGKNNQGSASLYNTGTNFGKSQNGTFHHIPHLSDIGKQKTSGFGQNQSNVNGSARNFTSEQPYQPTFTRAREVDKGPKFEGRLGEYRGDEDSVVCLRFPHKRFCGCEHKLYELDSNPIFRATEVRAAEQITPTVFIGSLESATNTKELLRLGITHVLNVSCVQYTNREQYFKYFNLEVYDNHDEDIKKFFRLTNRFIAEVGGAQQAVEKGKVLVHSERGASRAPSFVVAYLINNHRTTFKEAINLVSGRLKVLEINDYFKKQLEDYDLGKLASISNAKQSKSSN